VAAPRFNRIAIIGLGLIGSSLARAIREQQLAAVIVGCDSNELSLAYARRDNVIDISQTDPAAAVTDCDLVILASPPSTLSAIAKTIAPHLQPGATVMDVCSVKQAAIAAIAPHIPAHATYIPAHPIAGSTHTGIAHGRGDLFRNRNVILTPEKPEATPALDAVTALWHAMGAQVEAIPAALHDTIYAYVSHLPQLLAFTAAPALAHYLPTEDPILQKFTRLNASGTELWTDIFHYNQPAILTALDAYLDVVTHIETELSQAPQGSPSDADDTQAHTVLFPRIAASCLAITVMKEEKSSGCAFARYAGQGFADFTLPASQPPEEDIERISNQYQLVRSVLSNYKQILVHLYTAIASGDRDTLHGALLALKD
jgi:cyclohexadieny/prephenate dehydrogenase